MPLPFLPAHRVPHRVAHHRLWVKAFLNAWASLPTPPIALPPVQVRTIRHPKPPLLVRSPIDQVLRAARRFLIIILGAFLIFHLTKPSYPRQNVASTRNQAAQLVWRGWAGAASLPPRGQPCSSVLRVPSLSTGGA